MKKSLVAALATSAMAVLLVAPGTPAGAASPFCNQTVPNSSIFFYNKDTGSAGTATLAAGKYRFTGNFDLPTGYTHAAASRDSLLLYNADTGEGETGTFKAGRYSRVESYDDFSTDWSQIEASGDSILFYNSGSGFGITGTLKNGRYQEGRQYDNFSTGWTSMASSCDTLLATAGRNFGYGSLKGGVYTNVANRDGTVLLGNVVATKDSILGLASNGSQLRYKVSTATNGQVGNFREIGTSGVWDIVGRTADSLFFYKTDGTSWISKLSGGRYANVGSLNEVSSDWSIIEGGV
ncbi:hypothetical protein OG898_34090 [Streptomyces sp. NBC_00193]|uniref:hypothetical protein n=1 Tax=unclassified Streptomyces TaxID=2593676 RepID=UPI00225C1081|nr:MULTISPECIES: hypothetical protein [unclassified Streptomyces]MCX5127894.1 hypothetical protein [Streptomyces sp. NBC_00347]MCX5301439.1 hypothetical protein [Streptomyces sp. NBC_00193]